MQIIDFTKTIYHGMEVYPGDPDIKVEKVHQYDTHTWELRKLSLGSHTGTHVDAFSHMDKEGKNLDEIPLSHFIGPAERVEPEGLWPKNLGLLFSEEVSMRILDKLLKHKPSFVGGPLTQDLERALLKKQIITYTDLVNVENVPLNSTFLFIGLPLKIKEGDGSPVRAIGILDYYL